MASADIVGAISLMISVLSAVISVIFSIRAMKDSKLQQRGQLIDLKQSYYKSIQEWGDKVVDVLTEGIFLCDLDPNEMTNSEYFRTRTLIRQKLSSLIDQGRFFIPNENPTEHGMYKPSAYRGFRHPILNCLVNAYELLRRLSFDHIETNNQIYTELWDARKRFVSLVQEVLDPRTREKELKNLLAELKL